jgi:hypothetical protein
MTSINAYTKAGADAKFIPLTQKGAASGVATLDSSSTIPDAQIPAGIMRDTEATGLFEPKIDKTGGSAGQIPFWDGSAFHLGNFTTDAVPDLLRPTRWSHVYRVNPNGSRTLTVNTTNASSTITATSGTFTSADVGLAVSGTGIPAGATITGFTDGTHVTISSAATATNTGITLTVSDGSYATIGAAITQATTDRTALTGYVNENPGPWLRCLILVDPGTYNETATLLSYMDIVGSSGNREDVQWTWNGANPVIECSGKSNYLAHMAVIFGGTTTTTGTYALHADGSASLNAPATLICHDIRFRSDNPNRTSAMGIGTAGGQTQFYNQCVFENPLGGDSINYHNTSGTQPSRSFCIFYNCTIINGGGSGRGLLVTDQTSGKRDIVMWIGGSITVPGANAKVALINTAQQLTTVVVDPAVATSAQMTQSNSGHIVRAKAFPVVPVNGLSELERDWFFPYRVEASKTVISSAEMGAAVSGTVATANRVYFFPVTIDSARKIDALLVPVLSASGKISAGLYTDDGTGKPGLYLGASGITTAVAGQNALGISPNRYIFPGLGRVWIGVMADNTTITMPMDQYISTLANCYYADVSAGSGVPTGTPTVTALAAGVAVPVAALRTVQAI